MIKNTSGIMAGFSMDNLQQQVRLIGPGLALAALVAMAAQFLSEHYGAPVMLMAILLGIPFQFLSEEERTAPGILFASKTVLRVGVGLLGIRVSVGMVQQVGSMFLVAVALAVGLTILLSVLIAPLMNKDRMFGFLTGGAVAICGASAAMAIGSLLPKKPESERDLSFTVISVTLLSTVAMIFYPILVEMLGLDARHAGVFLGGTIHDVAQVVGAGYSISDEAGDFSTLVKLFRVTMLAPVVFIGALILRGSVPPGVKRPPLIPMFVIVFLVLAALNSLHVLPEAIKGPADGISRAALVTAVAAVGMKTSLKELRSVGRSAILMLLGQTAFLALFILLIVSV